MSDIRLDLAVTTDYARRGADVRDYVTLLKPRVMSLVVFTALVGIVAAPGGLHPLLAAVALLVDRRRAPARRASSTCGTTPTSTR